METLNDARLIIKLFKRQGVEIVAGILGGANLSLQEELAEGRRRCNFLAIREGGRF